MSEVEKSIAAYRMASALERMNADLLAFTQVMSVVTVSYKDLAGSMNKFAALIKQSGNYEMFIQGLNVRCMAMRNRYWIFCYLMPSYWRFKSLIRTAKRYT